MKAVNDTWRGLVRGRLLPLAIILVAALVTVPLVLAKEPEPVAPTAMKPVDESAAEATKTIVSLAKPSSKPRRLVTNKANPFRGKKLPKVKDPHEATVAATGGAPDAGSSAPTLSDILGAPTSGGGSPATTVPPGPSGVTPEVATPHPAPKHYSFQELTVRFGESQGEVKKRSVERLAPLPNAGTPVLIYLGVLKDGKTAVFLVDKGVTALGDGDCRPTPDKCETVRLKEGETEFLDVADETGKVTAQYQLDLIEIHNANSGSAARASRAGDDRPARSVRRARWGAAYGSTLQATVASETVSLP